MTTCNPLKTSRRFGESFDAILRAEAAKQQEADGKQCNGLTAPQSVRISGGLHCSGRSIPPFRALNV